jgi:hypothetical protein
MYFHPSPNVSEVQSFYFAATGALVHQDPSSVIITSLDAHWQMLDYFQLNNHARSDGTANPVYGQTTIPRL